MFRVGSQRVFFKKPQTQSISSKKVIRLRKLLKEADLVHTQKNRASPAG